MFSDAWPALFIYVLQASSIVWWASRWNRKVLIRSVLSRLRTEHVPSRVAKTCRKSIRKVKFHPLTQCELKRERRLFYSDENKVTMTYEVEWTSSETRWASRYVRRLSCHPSNSFSSSDRWDTYLAMSDVQIHWFSIVNSVIVVFFLAGILSMIIIRTLRRDIARYNEEDAVRVSPHFTRRSSTVFIAF